MIKLSMYICNVLKLYYIKTVMLNKFLTDFSEDQTYLL